MKALNLPMDDEVFMRWARAKGNRELAVNKKLTWLAFLDEAVRLLAQE